MGDPDQAIFGWRGAQVANMRDKLLRQYPSQCLCLASTRACIWQPCSKQPAGDHVLEGMLACWSAWAAALCCLSAAQRSPPGPVCTRLMQQWSPTCFHFACRLCDAAFLRASPHLCANHQGCVFDVWLCLLADSQTLFLRDNYRSTPEIVTGASTVLASCSHTRDPSGSAELRALKASGVPVSVSCCCGPVFQACLAWPGQFLGTSGCAHCLSSSPQTVHHCNVMSL